MKINICKLEGIARCAQTFSISDIPMCTYDKECVYQDEHSLEKIGMCDTCRYVK